MNKKYHVRLTDTQRQQLQDLIGSGQAPARRIARGRILLKVDENGPSLTDDQAAEACEVSSQTVARTRKRFDTEGFEHALCRKKPDRTYKRKIQGEEEAHLIALACSKPPEGRSRWSLRLLADKMVELDHVESVSYGTVRRALKKTS
mgnify:CR=1 FL=1|jgi:transposase